MRSLGFWVFSSETKFAKLVLFSFLSFTIIKIDFSNGMWWNKCDPDEELILTQYSNALFNVLWSTNDFNTHSLNVASEELCVVVCYYLQLQGRSWEISRRGSSVAGPAQPLLAQEKLTEALALWASRGVAQAAHRCACSKRWHLVIKGKNVIGVSFSLSLPRGNHAFLVHILCFYHIF